MIEKILIVDDSPVARKMLKSSLPKGQGYQLEEAGDGREAVEKFKAFGPDVIFMDLTMPVMDGYGAIEEIKKIDQESIIIVTTADVQQKAICRVMELGAFSVIKKPARPKIVKETLDKVLSKVEGCP